MAASSLAGVLLPRTCPSPLFPCVSPHASPVSPLDSSASYSRILLPTVTAAAAVTTLSQIPVASCSFPLLLLLSACLLPFLTSSSSPPLIHSLHKTASAWLVSLGTGGGRTRRGGGGCCYARARDNTGRFGAFTGGCEGTFCEGDWLDASIHSQSDSSSSTSGSRGTHGTSTSVRSIDGGTPPSSHAVVQVSDGGEGLSRGPSCSDVSVSSADTSISSDVRIYQGAEWGRLQRGRRERGGGEIVGSGGLVGEGVDGEGVWSGGSVQQAVGQHSMVNALGGRNCGAETVGRGWGVTAPEAAPVAPPISAPVAAAAASVAAPVGTAAAVAAPVGTAAAVAAPVAGDNSGGRLVLRPCVLFGDAGASPHMELVPQKEKLPSTAPAAFAASGAHAKGSNHRAAEGGRALGPSRPRADVGEVPSSSAVQQGTAAANIQEQQGGVVSLAGSALRLSQVGAETSRKKLMKSASTSRHRVVDDTMAGSPAVTVRASAASCGSACDRRLEAGLASQGTWEWLHAVCQSTGNPRATRPIGVHHLVGWNFVKREALDKRNGYSLGANTPGGRLPVRCGSGEFSVWQSFAINRAGNPKP